MIKLLCDKCGKELERSMAYEGMIYHPEIMGFYDPFDEYPTRFHFCKDCAKKFEQFLRGNE